MFLTVVCLFLSVSLGMYSISNLILLIKIKKLMPMKFNKLMRVRAICNFYHTVIYLFKTRVCPSSLLRPESYSFVATFEPLSRQVIGTLTDCFRVKFLIHPHPSFQSHGGDNSGGSMNFRINRCSRSYVFLLRVTSKMNIVYISCLL